MFAVVPTGYGKPFVVLIFLWFSMIGQWYGHILSKEQLTAFMRNLVCNMCKALMNWIFNCISVTQLEFTDDNFLEWSNSSPAAGILREGQVSSYPCLVSPENV